MGTDAKQMLFCGVAAVFAGCSLMSGDAESRPVEKVSHCAAVRPKLETTELQIHLVKVERELA